MTKILDETDESSGLLSIDAYTMAKVYKGRNGKYYLTPAVGANGIEALEKSVIDSIIDSKYIPIEEASPNIFQKNKDTIAAIDLLAVTVIEKFFTSINKPATLKRVDLDMDELDKIVNKKKGIARYNQFFFPLGVLIGEIIRKEVQGIWYLEKRYGYNPYFIPIILSTEKKTEYDPWFRLSRALMGRYPIDLNNLFDVMTVPARLNS